MREWWPIWTGFIALLCLAWGIQQLHEFLASYDRETNPIAEITVTNRSPLTTEQMRIDNCGWEKLGQLDRAMRCKDAIIAERLH